MAHIQIQSGDRPDSYRLTVDGTDLSFLVTRDLKVDFSGELPVVTMNVIATKVDIDLPDALVEALAVEAGAES